MKTLLPQTTTKKNDWGQDLSEIQTSQALHLHHYSAYAEQSYEEIFVFEDNWQS